MFFLFTALTFVDRVPEQCVIQCSQICKEFISFRVVRCVAQVYSKCFSQTDLTLHYGHRAVRSIKIKFTILVQNGWQ